MRNIFSGLYWIVLISFLMLVCLLALLMGTPGGTSFLVQKSTELSGQKIYVSNLEGTFLSGLKAGNIIIANDNLNLQLQDVEFEASFSALLKKEFHIKELKARLINVKLPAHEETKEDKPESKKLPELSSPLKVNFDSLEVGKLTIKTDGNPMVYSDIKISGSMYQSMLKINHLHSNFQTYSVDASGNFTFSQPFPLTLQADLADKNGSTLHARIYGGLEHYQLIAAANINHPSVPRFTAKLRSKGSLNHLNVDQLIIQALDNTLTIAGKIDWQEKLQIKTEFSAQDFNPGTIVAELPGNISLTGKASLIDQTLETQLKATGQLRGASLELETDLSLRNNVTNIRSARVSLGKNIATLKGRVSSKQADDIVFNIDAPDLSTFYPEVGGKLFAAGRLQGQWEKIEVESKIKGESIFFNTHHVKSLDLNIQPSNTPGEYKLNFLANTITSGEHSLESLSIKGDGNQKHQNIQFNLQGGPFKSRVGANISGQLESKTGMWRGELNQLHFSAADLPDYYQEQPSDIILSKSRQKISAFCLQGPTEKLCLDGDINLGKKSIINVNLKRLPLNRFSSWLPLSKKLTEHLSSNLKITGDNQHWQLDAWGELDSRNRMNALLSFNEEQKTIAGNVAAKFNKLQWINLFTEKINQPKGRLNANINLTGIIPHPQLSGTIKLEEGEARVPFNGTEINNASMLIDFQPDQIAKLSGELQSGDGNITITGETRWSAAPRWNADIHLKGVNFLAANLPVAEVDISPDLHIKGSEKGINVSGTVSIPKADIRIEDLPDKTIKVSPDEYIIGDLMIEPQQPAASPLLDVNADINIRLGTRVDLRGFGLDTGIEGRLKLRERPGRPTSGDGTLTMVDGKYSAFGKELIIEHGTLYFNGPLDTPRINLRVINPIEGIKVGLAISGTPRQPKSRIFSTPSMSETEALSYLLTGKPLNATGDSESGLLVNAAAKLGMKKSANRINNIRAKAGFDTLQLEAGDDLTESKLVVGKYLSARLYLEYVTQLFANTEVFSLRYEFSNKFHLEAESSDESQALDFIYQFEK